MRTIGRKGPGALLLPVLLAGPAWGQTVDDVVGRYLRARGGAERLRAVSSLRLTGTLELPGSHRPRSSWS